MTALSDSARLVDFVLWELRNSDLPADVQSAAWRLIQQRPDRPGHLPEVIRYTEGPLRVSGYYAGDDEREHHRRCYAHQTGHPVRELLAEGCTYILVQDVG